MRSLLVEFKAYRGNEKSYLTLTLFFDGSEPPYLPVRNLGPECVVVKFKCNNYDVETSSDDHEVGVVDGRKVFGTWLGRDGVYVQLHPDFLYEGWEMDLLYPVSLRVSGSTQALVYHGDDQCILTLTLFFKGDEQPYLPVRKLGLEHLVVKSKCYRYEIKTYEIKTSFGERKARLIDWSKIFDAWFDDDSVHVQLNPDFRRDGWEMDLLYPASFYISWSTRVC